MADRETNILNFWETTLTEEMGPTDLTANVADLQGLTSPAYAIIEPDSASQREIILFDGTWGASSMTTTTVNNRYLQGSGATSGLTHPNGAVVRLVPVAQVIQDLNDRIDADKSEFNSHASRHASGGADPLTVKHASTTGQTADDHHAEDHASRHESGGADEVALSPGQLTGLPVVAGADYQDFSLYSGVQSGSYVILSTGLAIPAGWNSYLLEIAAQIVTEITVLDSIDIERNAGAVILESLQPGRIQAEDGTNTGVRYVGAHVSTISGFADATDEIRLTAKATDVVGRFEQGFLTARATRLT